MSRKLWSIAAWSVIVLSVLILSMALIGVEFRPGQPLAGLGSQPKPQGESLLTRAPIFLLMLRILLIACVVLLPISIIVNLLSRGGRWRILAEALAFLVLLIAAGLLSRLFAAGSERVAQTDSALAELLQEEPSSRPASVPADQQPPSWLLWATIAVITVATAAVLARIASVMLRRRGRQATARVKVAEEAEAAIDSLQAGGDLRDVVIRCYSQMQRIVREKRGIWRGGATTPREFLAELEEAGIPAEPVRDLTQVFEEVRYGHAEPGPESERRAIASLSRIALFCRSTA